VEITDPTLVFLLITLGLVGIGIETLTPGGVIAGLVGVISLVFGIIGAIDLDATAGGIGLFILSMVLFISAVAFKIYRPLSIAGVITLALSGIFMFDRDADPTSIPAVIVGSMVLGGFLLFVIERTSTVKASPVRYGPEELVGMTGDVRQSLSPAGQVFIDGALWQAEISDPADPVRVGERIQVDGLRGLTLLVSRVPAAAVSNQKTEGAGR
jgi:membrane-bound serine protease (ClpP class)